jgi:probable HAF family extracellular repeat protein
MTRFHTLRIVWMAAVAAAAALPATAAVAAAPAGAATTTYTITDLGSLGFGISDGLAINNNGQVTGYSYLSKKVEVPCYPHNTKDLCLEQDYHAFLYSNGTMTDLGTLGGAFSKGLSINLSGQVVGPADTADLGAAASSFLFNGGQTLTNLSPMHAQAINDSGQIAGTCGSPLHACLESDGTITQLPDPANPAIKTCEALAINSSGQMAGTCLDTNGDEHAVLWNNGTATDLGTFGGYQAGAMAINNHGQVVGFAETSIGTNDGFLYSNGTLTDLGQFFVPAAINDNGVIVGGDDIYSGGTLQDLNNLIPAGSPYVINSATAINDNGQIVANGYDNTGTAGQTQALLLTPN